MTTFSRAKLKKSDGQTNIDKESDCTNNVLEYHFEILAQILCTFIDVYFYEVLRLKNLYWNKP